MEWDVKVVKKPKKEQMYDQFRKVIKELKKDEIMRVSTRSMRKKKLQALRTGINRQGHELGIPVDIERINGYLLVTLREGTSED